MTNNLKIGIALVIIAIIGAYYFPRLPAMNNGSIPSFGAVSGMLAESYIPYVSINQGYNSAKQIQTSALLDTIGTFQVGSTGTTMSRVNEGTCYFNPTATTIAASTTVTIDCQATAAVGVPNSLTVSALPGVTSGDVVEIILSTSTSAYNGTSASAFNGLEVLGASASNTPGYISIRLTNGFGTTYTYPVQATGGVNASGTATYIITH